MMRIFLDTNILLDLALQREHVVDAENLIQLGDEGKVTLCASCLSYVNIAYILRHHSLEEIYEYERTLREGIEVLPITAEQLDYAIANPSRDFEDMLQNRCAIAGLCDVIITNNKKDFEEFDSLPVQTAGEFFAAFTAANHS